MPEYDPNAPHSGQPTLEPGAGAVPPPDGGATPTGDAGPAGGSPEHYIYSWRGEERPLTREYVDRLSQETGVSPEGLLNTLQIGRDYDYHRRQAEAEDARRRQELEDRERELEARERRNAALLGQQGEPYRQPYPAPMPSAWGAPANPYAVPPQPSYPGGYNPVAPGYPNPYGQPAPPPAPFTGGMGYGPPLPPNVPPGSPLVHLAALPHYFQTFEQRMVGMIERERQERTRAEVFREAREEEAQLQTLADKYVERLKADGFKLPPNFTGEALLRESNRLGLSADPRIPWEEALETAAARHLWRHSYRDGQARLAADLDTNRGAAFRAPATQQAATSPPSAAPAGPAPSAAGASLAQRAEAARRFGANTTMREAMARPGQA